MSLTKSKDAQYPHFGDYKLFRIYMKKETYWAHLYGEAMLLIERVQVEGPELPNYFEAFYKINMKNHIVQVYIWEMFALILDLSQCLQRIYE